MSEPSTTEVRTTRLAAAVGWLRAQLQPGSVRLKDLRKLARIEGISTQSLYRAKACLPVTLTIVDHYIVWQLTPDDVRMAGNRLVADPE